MSLWIADFLSFTWNSIARLHLEFLRGEDALKAYERGYSTIPGSDLDENRKRIWLGRPHHRKAPTLKRDEAWVEAGRIKKMIEGGGRTVNSSCLLITASPDTRRLEAGEYAKATEELKQSDLTDPFHKLPLARAYEKSGDGANAQTPYKDITEFNQLTLERALSHPEAREKLKA